VFDNEPVGDLFIFDPKKKKKKKRNYEIFFLLKFSISMHVIDA